ncbi:MAG: PAS domain S-box protein [Rhodocyclaceae bacterium]|nr:PAS domain S-box protein [Rhodocyclaceae bacterium]
MNLKISHRLWLLAATAIVTFSCAVGLGVYSDYIQIEARQRIYETRIETDALAQISELVQANHRGAERLFELAAKGSAANGVEMQAIAVEIERNRDEITNFLHEYGTIGHDYDAEEQRLIARFTKARAMWLQALDAAIADAMARTGVAEGERHFRSQGAYAFEEAKSSLSDLRRRQGEIADELVANADRSLEAFRIYLVVLGLVGGGVLVAVTISAVRRIQRGIHDAQALAQEITQGDLGVDMRIEGPDELHTLMAHMGALRFSLYDLVSSIRASEARSRAVLRTMRDGVVEIDESGVILGVNEVLLEMFGYEEAEVVGKNVSMLMPEPHRGAHDGYLARYLKTRDARILHRRIEVEAVNKAGRPLPIDLLVNEMVDDDGSIFVGVIRDITAQKAVQKDLESALRAAQAATETKSAFLANMSHELRTPIGAITGFAQLAQRRQMPDDVRGYVEKINTSAQALLGLINDILDLSKIEAGKLELESIPFRLDEVLDHVSTLLNLRAQAKGVELVIGALPGVPDTLIGDPVRLGQVLVNLVSNAVKFTEQGQVSLMCEPVHLESYPNEVILSFTIRDTGIGIPTEALPSLFTPFSQVDGSTTRRFGGTGLGLAICKQLVEQMGGEIGVNSEPGVGSEFWLTIALERGTDNLTVESRGTGLGGKRVLVADDNAM